MTDGSNIVNLLEKNLYDSIDNLFKKTNVNGEFEFIFSNRDGKYITQEKYIKLLKYLYCFTK